MTEPSNTLCGILNKILMDFAFVFMEEGDSEFLKKSLNLKDFIHVEVAFSGFAEGVFLMVLPVSLCRTITSNIPGFDETSDFTREQWQDGAKEILNIVGSHVLNEIYGSNTTFNMARPLAKNLVEEEYQQWSNDNEIAILKDDNDDLICAKLNVFKLSA